MAGEGRYYRVATDIPKRERRDPTAATRSLRWLSPGQTQPPDWDAGAAFERAYYSNIAVYACFQAIAATVSSLPFRAGPNPDTPQDYDTNAPLARLLGPPPSGPNPTMSAEKLWFWSVVQYLATGRFGWEIETAPGSDQIVALWPLVSSYLKPIPSTSGNNWFAGFTYGRPGDERRYRTDQVVYVWNSRGSDFRQPESALEAAAMDVSIATMQSRYDYAFYKNDAMPRSIMVTEMFAEDDDFQAFKEQWFAEYGGPSNAGRTAHLESADPSKAVAVQTLGTSPKDAQAAQRYMDRLKLIAAGLGVPWSRLDASGRTFDNAAQEDLIWWEQRLNPLLRDFASQINIQLAPRLGSLVGWFDLSKVRALQERARPTTQAVGADVLVAAQIMTVDEARADYGLPPLPNGEGAGLVPKPEPVPPPVMPIPVAASADDETRKLHDYKGDGGPCEICGKIPKHTAHGYFFPPTNETKSAGPDHEQRRRVLAITDATRLRLLERDWVRTWRKIFAAQSRSVLAQLERTRTRARLRDGEIRQTVDEVFDPARWTAETVDDLEALYERLMVAGGTRVSEQFGLAFDLEAQYAQQFIQDRANQLAGQVTNTTYQAIKDALTAGVAEGESIPDLAARIRGVFEQASNTRAVTIARTEVVSAYNGSATLTALEYGTDIVAGKEWLTTIDGREREWHAARDGEIVPISENFSGGLPYPGTGDASEVVNCRCTVAFLTPDEMKERGIGRSVAPTVARTALAMLPDQWDEATLRRVLRVA